MPTAVAGSMELWRPSEDHSELHPSIQCCRVCKESPWIGSQRILGFVFEPSPMERAAWETTFRALTRATQVTKPLVRVAWGWPRHSWTRYAALLHNWWPAACKSARTAATACRSRCSFLALRLQQVVHHCPRLITADQRANIMARMWTQCWWTALALGIDSHATAEFRYVIKVTTKSTKDYLQQ